MRRVRYAVAASLDGFIAGPNGEADWIVRDPEIDFKALFAQFDTALIGRRTFETMVNAGNTELGMKTFVFSRTLRQTDFPTVTIVSENSKQIVAELREQKGKDIWLFGGASLFSSLLKDGLVDTVEVAVIPILLGAGIPLMSSTAGAKLRLTGHKVYRESGIVSLEYAVARGVENSRSRAGR